MLQIAVIADDLTGAMDTGARFAEAGLATLVALGSESLPPFDVLAVTTESRHSTRNKAARRAMRAAKHIRSLNPEHAPRVYKKIDSTLRGHPGAELAAIMDALEIGKALVAPAFPAQGRTTMDATQLVDGVPVAETAFGDEVPTSDVRALFSCDRGKGAGIQRPVWCVTLATVRCGHDAVSEILTRPGEAVVVADAATHSDLATLARAAITCGIRLLCGSAGLASALADVLQLSSTVDAPESVLRPVGPVFVVAGSPHPQTVEQVNVARQHGTVVVQPDEDFLRDASREIQATAERITALLGDEQDAILTTVGLSMADTSGQEIADRLARTVRNVLDSVHAGGLVLTGGDVAMAACTALDASAIWIRGEVLPGVPWGILIGGTCPGLPVVTKAGGFGNADSLVAAIDHCHSLGRPTTHD